MHNARFTEHQIITVIKSVEAGRTVKDVCREADVDLSDDDADTMRTSRYGRPAAPGTSL